MEAIASSVDRAEQASGTRILSAHVGIAGPHISSMNSRGIVAIADPRHPIIDGDVHRALESARIVNVPNNREVVHVIPRYYVVDAQDHVVDPLGMFGSRLDVETHARGDRRVGRALRPAAYPVGGDIADGDHFGGLGAGGGAAGGGLTILKADNTYPGANGALIIIGATYEI